MGFREVAMSSRTLQKVALGASLLILVGAVWFWALQVGDVLELLELAYGE